MNIRLLFLLLVTLGLSACAEQTTKSVELVPVEERNMPVEKAQPAIVKPEIINDGKSKAVNKKKESVIVALLENAKQFSNEGQSEKAAATIERALRIEPKNALLWHHLAAVRLQQQQWQQAIVMARKSNALAVNNTQLKSDNWALIAAAYDSLGNKKKANEARNKQSGQA
jgi:tetratricopeptide (TPR) repeat protein